jgi:tetratricopeptide (TPR) repeat protein
MLFAAVVTSVPAWPQAPAPSSATEAIAAHGQGRLLLVLPFEDHALAPNLGWIGEAVPELLNERLAAARFMPIGRADRLYALDHLGLPPNFQPSHASMLRLAQTLDADYVVFGSYSTSGNRLKASARILDVKQLKLGPAIDSEADLVHMLDLLNTLAWRIARQLDPSYAVAEQTFVAADAHLRVDAFENYIRGLVEESSSERIRHLREAARISPDFDPAWLGLGRAYFSAQDYDQAAIAFGHLRTDDPRALEADFYRGLALFYLGKYDQAEDAFSYVGTRLPLPEVVNNQAVCAARRGKDGVPLFLQAITADPNDADYHFNAALGFYRRNDVTNAQHQLELALKLRPADREAQQFAATLRSGTRPPAATAPPPAGAPTAAGSPQLPLERIKRGYNEASFRQAASAIEQMQAMRLATMPAAERATALSKSGTQYLGQGLMLEAEREFRAALEADPRSATAHAGLAQVRERSADAEAARQEAQQSLALEPNVPAHLVLARLDLKQNQLGAAAGEVSQALKLQPNDPAARGLRQALETRGQPVP